MSAIATRNRHRQLLLNVKFDHLAENLPRHHPGQVSGRFIEGTIEFLVESGLLETLKVGDSISEPAMIPHKAGRYDTHSKPGTVPQFWQRSFWAKVHKRRVACRPRCIFDLQPR